MFHVAHRFFRQRSLVEDAAQEVFLKAFTQLGSYEGRGSMEGWLTRIATNICLNILRASKRRPELTTADLTEDQDRWLDEKLSSAAGELHHSAENKMAKVKVRAFRARKKAREAMEKLLGRMGH